MVLRRDVKAARRLQHLERAWERAQDRFGLVGRHWDAWEGHDGEPLQLVPEAHIVGTQAPTCRKGLALQGRHRVR